MRNNTKQLIMDTAWKHFSLYGYTDTNLEKICSDAGITRGPLYYYFKDKEDLYRQVVIREAENIQKAYTEIFTADISLMEMLKKDMELCTSENPFVNQFNSAGSETPKVMEMNKLSSTVYNLKRSAFEKAQHSGMLKDGVSVDEMINFLYIFTFGVKTLDNSPGSSAVLKTFDMQSSISIFLEIFQNRYIK